MRLSKMHMVVQLVLMFGISMSAQAESNLSLPSSEEGKLTTETTEIDGMQFKAQYTNRECAVEQGKSVKAVFENYKFRRMLENVGVKRIEIIAKDDYAGKQAKASFSKDGKVFYVRAYRPWVRVTVPDGFEMDRDWHRPMYDFPKTKVVDRYQDCSVLSQKELLAYGEKIAKIQSESSADGQQSTTTNVDPNKGFLATQ